MQAKDVPERPILEFLAGLAPRWATHWQGFDNSIPASPEIPEKVLLAKMAALERRGLITGCSCGCRGDWEITDKGREHLKGTP